MATGINNNLQTDKKSNFSNFCATFSDQITRPNKSTFGQHSKFSISDFFSQTYKQPRQQNSIINSINSFSSSILDGMIRTGDRIGNGLDQLFGGFKKPVFNTLETAKNIGTARVDIHEGAMNELLKPDNFSEKAFKSITGAYPTRIITNGVKKLGATLDTISGFKSVFDGLKKDRATGNNLYTNTFLNINKSIFKMASSYAINVGAGALTAGAAVAAASVGITLSPLVVAGGAIALTLAGAYYAGYQIDKFADRRAQATGL
jgi:hypothetical protein